MATDAEIRAAGFYAVPEQRFLRDPFQLPTKEVVEEETESFGIPQTQAFTNSGGNNYTGGYNFGNTGFQQAVDARQSRLNAPIDTSTFMGKAKDFMSPQSANDIRTSGYQEPKFQPGIMATMIGKLDNYRNLPRADQAFIAQNMGYTGPTIFGENNSGLGKDPFGINTRSAFGNYAQHSRDMAAEDGDLAETVADQIARGLTNTIQMKQLAFHREKQKQAAIDLEIAQSDAAAANDKATNKGFQKAMAQGDAFYDTLNNGRGATSTSKSRAEAGGGKASNKGEAGSGWENSPFAKGGRAGYFFGGRVNFKAGGRTNYVRGGAAQDMGNAENQAASAAAAGPSSSSSSNDGPRGPAELGLTTRAPPGPGNNNNLEQTTIIQKIKNNPIINNPLTRLVGRLGMYQVNPALMGVDYRTAMALKETYDEATEDELNKFANGGLASIL